MSSSPGYHLDSGAGFLVKSQKSCFTPFGVAHGWNKASYRQSVEALLAMGYKNITMGDGAPENGADP